MLNVCPKGLHDFLISDTGILLLTHDNTCMLPVPFLCLDPLKLDQFVCEDPCSLLILSVIDALPLD